jgi:hypothetical protein
MRVAVALAVSLLLFAACSSPEATRARGGGNGADVGNVADVVQMHAGSQPYWNTPRLVEPVGPMPLALPRQAPAEQAVLDGRASH